MVISFVKSSYSTIPPTMTQLNKNEVSLWSFSWMPAIDSFDEKGLHDGHT